MKYSFEVEWNQLGIAHDISELVTVPENLNRGVGAPDQLYSFTSGDVEIEAADIVNPSETEEPFRSVPFFTAILNLSQLPSYQQEAIVTIRRDGEVLFRGLVDPITVQTDPRRRTARFVILGPMRLCDRTKADQVRRSFPDDVRTIQAHVKGERWIRVNRTDLEVLVEGDVINIGGEDYPCSGAGYIYGTSIYVIILQAGLKDDLDSNAPVTLSTPWLRNQYIGDNVQPGLIQELLSRAGITNSDVRWTGLISDEKFLSMINYQGVAGTVGVREGMDGATRKLRIVGQDRIWETTNQYLAPTLTSLTVGEGASDFIGGPYHDPAVDGFLTQAAPGNFSQAYQMRDDSLAIFETAEYGVYRTIRRSYAMRGTKMFELEFTQDCEDVNFDGTSNFTRSWLPNYASGGRGYKILIRCWRTTDFGLTWVQDTTWFQTYSNTTVTPIGTGAGVTWRYSVEFRDSQNRMLARAPTGATFNGAATLDGSNYNRFSWGASPAGTAQVLIYREEAGGVPASIGLLAIWYSSGAGSYNDQGSIPISTMTACPLYTLRVEEQPTYRGECGALYDWSIGAMPYMNQGPSVTHILYFNQWGGGGAPAVLWRVTIGTYATGWRLLHYDVGGFRVTFTNSWTSYGGVGAVRHCHIYWLYQAPDGNVGLVHDEDDGVNWSTPTNHVFYLGSLRPYFRSLVWNGVDGVNSRIGILFSDGVNGTSFMEFFSGGTWAVEGYSFFSRIQNVIIDPECATYNGATGQIVYTQPQRMIGPLWDTTPPWWVSGTFGQPNPNPKYGGGRLVVARWRVTIGSLPVDVWFVSNGRKIGIISDRNNGFISVADFKDLDVSMAIRELAFVVNATFDVDYDDLLQPVAQFIGRDVDPPSAPKILANLDWSAPAGAHNDLVMELEYDRAWMHTYPFVTVKGRSLKMATVWVPWWEDAEAPENVDIVETAGDSSREGDGLEITARFADTPGLCKVIANNIYRFHAPALKSFSAPVLSTSYPFGFSWQYAVIAYDSLGKKIAVSKVAVLANGPSFVSFALRILLSWETVSGAVDYKVVRVAVPSSSGNSIGVIAVAIGNNTSYQDIGISADGSVFTGDLLSPRQAAKVTVFDDGTAWRQRAVVHFPDPYGSTDTVEASKAPAWWVENIDRSITSARTLLSVVMRDAR